MSKIKDSKQRKSRAVTPNARLTKMLYKNSKDRWISESIVSEFVESASRERVITSSTFSRDDLKVFGDWMTESNTSIPPSIYITDNESFGFTIKPMESEQLNTTNLYPDFVDFSSSDAKLLARKLKFKNIGAIYESVSVSDTDLFINACGPVWAVAFAPDESVTVSGATLVSEYTQMCQFTKFLAVGVSQFGWPSSDGLELPVDGTTHVKTEPVDADRLSHSGDRRATVDGLYGVGSDYQRSVGQTDTADNILQIWRVNGEVQFNERVAAPNGYVRSTSSTKSVGVVDDLEGEPATPVKKGRGKGKANKAADESSAKKQKKTPAKKTPAKKNLTKKDTPSSSAAAVDAELDLLEGMDIEEYGPNVDILVEQHEPLASITDPDGDDEQEDVTVTTGRAARARKPVDRFVVAAARGRKDAFQPDWEDDDLLIIPQTHITQETTEVGDSATPAKTKGKRGRSAVKATPVSKSTPKAKSVSSALKKKLYESNSDEEEEESASDVESPAEQEGDDGDSEEEDEEEEDDEDDEDDADDDNEVVEAKQRKPSKSTYVRKTPVAIAPESRPPPPPMAPSTTSLAYCVALSRRGPTWGLCWSPLGVAAKGGAVLGALAVVCGDGSCLVMVLPREVRSGEGVRDSSFAHALLLDEQAVCRVEIRPTGGVMVSCAAWDPHRPHQLICGLTNGDVTVWALQQHLCSLDSSTSYPVRVSQPLLRLADAEMDSSIAAFSSVTSVQACPFDRDLILVGGCDNAVKIWNRNDCFQPVYKRTFLSSVSHLSWDPLGVGIYISVTDSTSVYWDHLWASNKDSIMRFYLYSHVHKFGGIWQSTTMVNDDQTCIVSVASDGSVRGGFVSVFAFGKNSPTESLLEYFRVLDVASPSPPTGMQSSRSASSSSCEGEQMESVARVTVSLASQSFADSYALESFTDKNSVAMHTVDSTLVAVGHSATDKRQGSVHLVAYGGAAGLVRIHSINPMIELMHNAKG